MGFFNTGGVCNTGFSGLGGFGGSGCGIINLVIILIALEFLTGILCGNCVTDCNNVCGC